MIELFFYFESSIDLTGRSSGPVGGGELWQRGPNLPQFSTFSTDLGHFLLKVLKLNICCYFMFFFFNLVICGQGK